jgi:hypothetical protein
MNAAFDDVKLARLLEVAEADLAAAADGQPLCKVSMTGTTGQAMKYFEGRWAALREISRGADPIEAFRRWRGDHEHYVKSGAGPAWVHYTAGGTDALFELID